MSPNPIQTPCEIADADAELVAHRVADHAGLDAVTLHVTGARLRSFDDEECYETLTDLAYNLEVLGRELSGLGSALASANEDPYTNACACLWAHYNHRRDSFSKAANEESISRAVANHKSLDAVNLYVTQGHLRAFDDEASGDEILVVVAKNLDILGQEVSALSKALTCMNDNPAANGPACLWANYRLPVYGELLVRLIRDHVEMAHGCLPLGYALDVFPAVRR